MSLFADKWPSAFDRNPFGLGSLRPPFHGFGDRPDDDFFSDMRLRKGPSFAERGFYDDFDSIFHDLKSPRSRRHFGFETDNGDFGRSAAQSTNPPRGKEYIIPIKVETATSPAGYSTSSSKFSNEARSRLNGGPSNTHSSSISGGGAGGRGRVIHIPIVRETSTQKNSRDKSRSPTEFSVPKPTTDENRTTNRKQNDDVICLDSDSFFKPPYPSKQDSDIEIVEDEEKEEEIQRSLCRKPLRHDASSVSSSRSLNGATLSQKLSKFHGHDVKQNDVRHEAEEREREETRRERKKPCAHSGVNNVTPPPSYPIYDHLKPRLASLGRQVDYIQGDGNCFFRALSKEMYGTEDFHAEWRQAVCDIIAAHPHVFQQYIDASSVASHVGTMRENGTWATTCEIYAAASLLRREVYVLAPTPRGGSQVSEYHWLLFSPRALSGATPGASSSRLIDSREGSHDDDLHPCYLTLCHTNGNHYDRIVPTWAHCNCEMDPPTLNAVSVLVDLTQSEEEEMLQD